MSDLEKLKFPALDVGGTNYIVWALEANNYLCADGIGNTIEEDFVVPTGNSAADVNNRKNAARAVCLLLRHLHKDLKFNYLEEQNPSVIWTSLRLRFDTDRKQAMLPLLSDEWNKLCFYNFKTVTEYATKLYSIASELSWCGRKLSEQDKIEKTLTTFNPAERILSMQYRRMNHDTFDKLIASLLLDEKHGLLLQRNHDERRIPANPDNGVKQPKAHFGDAGGQPKCGGRGNFRNKQKGKAGWKQNGSGKHANRARGKGKFDQRQRQRSNAPPGKCHRCGLSGHWAIKCKTPEFHCKLFQESQARQSRSSGGNFKKKTSPERKVAFMTDFWDDSDQESHCVESYSNAVPESPSHCLVDCATTHVILSDKRFFVDLEASKAPSNIKTVGGSLPIAQGAGRARVSLPNGTVIDIEKAIYAPSSSRNLLSFADLRKNGLHVNTATMFDGTECLQLVDRSGRIVEECPENGNGLYFTHIVPTTPNGATFASENEMQPPVADPGAQKLSLWHDRLGHPGRNMLSKMSKAIHNIPLQAADIAKHGERLCHPCAMGKLQSRKVDLPNFLK